MLTDRFGDAIVRLKTWDLDIIQIVVRAEPTVVERHAVEFPVACVARDDVRVQMRLNVHQQDVIVMIGSKCGVERALDRPKPCPKR